MTQWIDFKLLKQQLSFETVLAHYGVEHRSDGPNHVKCKCPFHEDGKPSLGVDLERKIWQCFACKASGNILDFVTRMEGFDPDQDGAIRKGAEAAIKLAGIEHDGPAAVSPQPKPPHTPKSNADNNAAQAASSSAPEQDADFGPRNEPLSFELKLERGHGFLKSSGLRAAVLDKYGIGVCKRGLMKSRVCFPLREADGTLVGYAGRWASNDLPAETPVWLFPPKFNGARFVYGLDQLAARSHHIALAPDYWTVLALAEAGLPAAAIWDFGAHPPQIDRLKASGVKQLTLIEPDEDCALANLSPALLALGRAFHVGVRRAADLASVFEAIEEPAQTTAA